MGKERKLLKGKLRSKKMYELLIIGKEIAGGEIEKQESIWLKDRKGKEIDRGEIEKQEYIWYKDRKGKCYCLR